MRFYFFIITSLLWTSGISQTVRTDTSFFQVSKNNVISEYEGSLPGQQLYYNGSGYQDGDWEEDEHPYFLTNDFASSDIVFEGNLYKNVPVMYNIATDQLITESPSGVLFVINPHWLERFTFRAHHFEIPDKSLVAREHHFEFLDKTKFNNSIPRTGFYEILYNGQSHVIAFHEKNYQEKMNGTTIEVYFDQRHRYFILKNGNYHPIRSKKSLLNILSDQQHELKVMIRKEHLKFRHNKAKAYSRVAELYDSLKASSK